MAKTYYEVVFEGHFRAITGLLEGFKLGSGKKDWTYYFSKARGIKTETFTEIILEWITLQTKMHHVVMEADFYTAFDKALGGIAESAFVSKRYIRSALKIKEASFQFVAKTYGQKYGNEIKALLKNLPSDLVLHDYNPIEKIDENAKGVELYAPEHSYTFEAMGRLAGDLGALVEFRKKLDDHPLVEVKEIILSFQ
ncbi:MAG: hypothetical protein CVV44_14810 [Spirochaetae bacterium HGW-Spirochaetae-1]|jgi:hypothetical protein|nr:MAG: hypothetical protein CVV44_14810 [Spirochaetae bacterium HGW-Spirochaetae-1]